MEKPSYSFYKSISRSERYFEEFHSSNLAFSKWGLKDKCIFPNLCRSDLKTLYISVRDVDPGILVFRKLLLRLLAYTNLTWVSWIHRYLVCQPAFRMGRKYFCLSALRGQWNLKMPNSPCGSTFLRYLFLDSPAILLQCMSKNLHQLKLNSTFKVLQGLPYGGIRSYYGGFNLQLPTEVRS